MPKIEVTNLKKQNKKNVRLRNRVKIKGKFCPFTILRKQKNNWWPNNQQCARVLVTSE